MYLYSSRNSMKLLQCVDAKDFNTWNMKTYDWRVQKYLELIVIVHPLFDYHLHVGFFRHYNMK